LKYDNNKQFLLLRNTANTLAVKLNGDGIKCDLLSGELDVDQRAAVIERFRNGNSKLLITTNVAARGK
jgi:ATP-dependent RNA helicase DDX19/DBP5